MTEAFIGILIGSTLAWVAAGALAHRREQEEPGPPPPPPPRVQVWSDNRLVYDGPERRSSPRLRTDSEQSYRWPDLVEEATTEPTEDEDDVEHARRWVGQVTSIEEFEMRRRMAAEREVRGISADTEGLDELTSSLALFDPEGKVRESLFPQEVKDGE